MNENRIGYNNHRKRCENIVTCSTIVKWALVSLSSLIPTQEAHNPQTFKVSFKAAAGKGLGRLPACAYVLPITSAAESCRSAR